MSAGERACSALIHEFGRLVDAGTPELVAELFTVDGVLARAGAVARGREEIASSIQPAPAGVRRMHFYTNVVVTVEAADAASASFYYQAFLIGPDGTATSVIGSARDRYVRTSEGWRIAHRVQQRLADTSRGGCLQPAG